MRKILFMAVLGVLLFRSINNSNNINERKEIINMDTIEIKTNTPDAKDFVSSPLRSRIVLELNASVKEVWELVGNFERMPEYSEGLNWVKTMKDKEGDNSEFLCNFKPEKPGEKEIEHRSIILWYEALKGWAEKDEEPNDFGLTESLALVTLEQKNNKTVLKWDMHFNSQDISKYLKSLEYALNVDVARRLISKFGGKELENYIELER